LIHQENGRYLLVTTTERRWSGLLCWLVLWLFVNVSEERTTSIFRTKTWAFFIQSTDCSTKVFFYSTPTNTEIWVSPLQPPCQVCEISGSQDDEYHDSFPGYSGVVLKQTDVSEVHATSVINALMEAVRTSETSVYFNETTRRSIPEGCSLHTCQVFTLPNTSCVNKIPRRQNASRMSPAISHMLYSNTWPDRLQCLHVISILSEKRGALHCPSWRQTGGCVSWDGSWKQVMTWQR
jgi:hypothetical protein